jgi:peptide/nickel transport system substrate-binding protein
MATESHHRRHLQPSALAAVMTFALAAACTSTTGTRGAPPSPTSPSASSPTRATPTAPQQTPRRGGTLRIVGFYGTDYLDANLSYYSLGYSLLREFSRQLYTWPADPANVTGVVPDLATAPPTIDASRTRYTVTIRPRARWDTSPPRQVTAADVVRGVEISCNPVQPSGAAPDLESVIAGMTKFCHRFRHVPRSAPAIARYLATAEIPGVHVGANPLQVVFELSRPVNYFADMLAMPAFSPRPREQLRYLPGTNQSARHIVSDGPYRLIGSHVDYGYAQQRIVFRRNPVWRRATDPVRGAYVDRIVLSTGNGYPTRHPSWASVRQMQAGTADLCMCGLTRDDITRLDRRRTDDPLLSLHPEIATNPYLVFNTVSPNNHGALKNVEVRRAISYALDHKRLAKALGGKELHPMLTQVLPTGVLGSQDVDLYPNNPEVARRMLSTDGPRHLTLKMTYRESSPSERRLFDVLSSELSAVGIRVRVVQDELDFYTALLTRPASTRAGDWDIALSGWAADWQGNAAWSYLHPLFDGRSLPPTGRSFSTRLPPGSSNFGLYDNPDVDRLIDQASVAPDLDTAARLWQQADATVMRDAAIYPITQPNVATYQSARVRNAVYLPALEGFDLTNVWLRRSG